MKLENQLYKICVIWLVILLLMILIWSNEVLSSVIFSSKVSLETLDSKRVLPTSHTTRILYRLAPHLAIVEVEPSLGRHQDSVAGGGATDPGQGGHQGALELHSARHVGDPET